ncbi:MAG TPA: NAD(P)/FAD-dependent oxidoreductase [Ilumatobacteraceae bacterium]
MTMPIADQTAAWLSSFAAALHAGDQHRFEELFLDESYWRDMVALTWDTCQFWGRATVSDELIKHAAAAGMTDIHLDPDRSAPKATVFLGTPVVELFYAFRTNVGTGKGFVRLVIDEASELGIRAQLIATGLVGLDCAPEPTERHPHLGFDPAYPGQTWGEWTAAKSDFSERDPDVLIIGGSHSGLSVGARFERKGISYLIVERNAAPGDMWRGRYESLALHTHTRMNDLPYLSLPAHWGSFTPKDQWADWLDCYARLMNLNLWTSTEAVSGTFDAEARRWEVRLRRADGTERTMHPKHVVLAVGGIGGRPKVPDLPGLDDFAGEVLHSSAFKTGAAYTGRRVMVVGSSTTAHDICLDLFHKGAVPTMAQRGPTCVVNIAEQVKFSADYATLAIEEADQLRSSMVLPLIIKRGQAGTVMTEQTHAELHDGLRKAGQKLTIGADQTGWTLKLFRDTRGYYLNVGCSEAIVAGKVKVLDFEQIDRFVAEGALLADGTVMPLEVVVLATGFHDLSVDIETLLGADVAAKFDRCIGVADDGEYRTMSRPTAQAHLWLINGGIIDARKSSDLLALQIIAQMHGLVPSLVRQPDGTVRAL